MNEKQKLLISDSLQGVHFGMSDRMALLQKRHYQSFGDHDRPFYIKYKGE